MGRYELRAEPSWFDAQGRPHHIGIGRDACRELGLSPELGEKGAFRIFASDQHVATGAANAETGFLTRVAVLFQRLGLRVADAGSAVVQLEIDQDDRGPRLRFSRKRQAVVNPDPRAHWWASDAAERYWVEIRHRPGTGRELRCPLADKDDATNAWYDLVGLVRPGDSIYHWNAEQHRFVGRSRVVQNPVVDVDHRVVELEGFTALHVDVGLERMRAAAADIETVRGQLIAAHPGRPLYLPFQFRSDGLRMLSNYFAKLPRALVLRLFGEDGLGEDALPPPPVEEGLADEVSPAAVRPTFLSPFKAKADSEYVSRVVGGSFRRGRHHETLVNAFASYLASHGLEPGCNMAIDLGIATPPVVVEAKIVTRWSSSIREAVGQLYEYRYFKVADPEAGLIFLASKPIPDVWHQYLEADRGIASAWRNDDGSFHLCERARAMLGMNQDPLP